MSIKALKKLYYSNMKYFISNKWYFMQKILHKKGITLKRNYINYLLHSPDLKLWINDMRFFHIYFIFFHFFLFPSNLYEKLLSFYKYAIILNLRKFYLSLRSNSREICDIKKERLLLIFMERFCFCSKIKEKKVIMIISIL